MSRPRLPDSSSASESFDPMPNQSHLNPSCPKPSCRNPSCPNPSCPNPSWEWTLVWMSELCVLAHRLPPGALVTAQMAAHWHPAIDPIEVDDAATSRELARFVLERHREHVRLAGSPDVRCVDSPGALVSVVIGTLEHEALRLLGLVFSDAIVAQRWTVLGRRLDDLIDPSAHDSLVDHGPLDGVDADFDERGATEYGSIVHPPRNSFS